MGNLNREQLENRSYTDSLRVPKLSEIDFTGAGSSVDWSSLKAAQEAAQNESTPYMACQSTHISTFSEQAKIRFAGESGNCPKGAENCVYRFEQYQTDAVVVRKGRKPAAAFLSATRGEIGANPSAASLQRLVFFLNNCQPQVNTMLTLTISPECEATADVELHKAAKNAACQRLRRLGFESFVWVREFTAAGRVHWHIFLNDPAAATVADKRLAKHLPRCVEWSTWWAKYYQRKGCDVGKMASSSACWEVLCSSAAGKYAAKEGAKRFQKLAPKAWQVGGGAWWRASRKFSFELLGSGMVTGADLDWAFVDLGNERAMGVPRKYQRSKQFLEAV